MDPYQANALAVGGYAKAIRQALLKLGMRRCSVRLVYRQTEAPVKSHRLDWYTSFWRWFEALWMAHRKGAEFLYEDFCARTEALRLTEEAYAENPDDRLAECERERADLIQAALRREDPHLLIEMTKKVIVAERRYLASLIREGNQQRTLRARRIA